MSPNGRYILNDLEFDREIEEMSDRKLAEFSAKLGYSNAIRITKLENRGKRSMGAAGGAGVLIGGIIAGVFEFFRRS